jgi:hypothetical protein
MVSGKWLVFNLVVVVANTSASIFAIYSEFAGLARISWFALRAP